VRIQAEDRATAQLRGPVLHGAHVEVAVLDRGPGSRPPGTAHRMAAYWPGGTPTQRPKTSVSVPAADLPRADGCARPRRRPRARAARPAGSPRARARAARNARASSWRGLIRPRLAAGGARHRRARNGRPARRRGAAQLTGACSPTAISSSSSRHFTGTRPLSWNRTRSLRTARAAGFEGLVGHSEPTTPSPSRSGSWLQRSAESRTRSSLRPAGARGSRLPGDRPVTIAGSMWVQRDITLQPRPRGFHLVTREVLAELPELAGTDVGAAARPHSAHTSASLTLNGERCARGAPRLRDLVSTQR